MKKLTRTLAILAFGSIAVTACTTGSREDDNNRQDATEQTEPDKPAYDLAKTRQLLEAAEQFSLTDVQLNDLIDQLDGLLNHVSQRTAQIATMPVGDARCQAFDELKTSTEVGAVKLAYNVLNRADRQSGFNATIGQRIKALNAPARMDKISVMADSIYAGCKGNAK